SYLPGGAASGNWDGEEAGYPPCSYVGRPVREGRCRKDREEHAVVMNLPGRLRTGQVGMSEF
ncbi:MAG: hypothetical protein WA899_15165, partial [Candidatus Sulfotelmatobacter sp.]